MELMMYRSPFPNTCTYTENERHRERQRQGEAHSTHTFTVSLRNNNFEKKKKKIIHTRCQQLLLLYKCREGSQAVALMFP